MVIVDDSFIYFIFFGGKSYMYRVEFLVGVFLIFIMLIIRYKEFFGKKIFNKIMNKLLRLVLDGDINVIFRS